MYRSFSITTALAFCWLLNPVLSQDLVSANAAAKPISEWYDEQIGNNSRIFTGSEYAIRYDRVVDHQYLMQGWEPGSILFQGRKYDGLEVRYDVVNDQVIFKHFDPSNGRMMALRPAQEKISGFTINSRQFVYLNADTSDAISGGFYEQLLDKEYKLYIKHSKEQFVDKSRGAPVVGFQYRARIYLYKEGAFFYIRKRGSLLKILTDEKKELKAYARSHNVFWKENPRRAAALLVSYYLRLKQEDGTE